MYLYTIRNPQFVLLFVLVLFFCFVFVFFVSPKPKTSFLNIFRCWHLSTTITNKNNISATFISPLQSFQSWPFIQYLFEFLVKENLDVIFWKKIKVHLRKKTNLDIKMFVKKVPVFIAYFAPHLASVCFYFSFCKEHQFYLYEELI